MTLHDYPSIVQAEIDRGYELSGVDRHGTRRSNRPRSDRTDRAGLLLGARRLVAYLARLLGTEAAPRSGAVRGIPGAAVCPRQL